MPYLLLYRARASKSPRRSRLASSAASETRIAHHSTACPFTRTSAPPPDRLVPRAAPESSTQSTKPKSATAQLRGTSRGRSRSLQKVAIASSASAPARPVPQGPPRFHPLSLLASVTCQGFPASKHPAPCALQSPGCVVQPRKPSRHRSPSKPTRAPLRKKFRQESD